MTAGDQDPRRLYPLRVPSWSEIPNLVHGFLGREHSLPPGPFTIRHIRAALASAGETPTSILAVQQVHGARVVTTEASEVEPAARGERTLPHLFPEADAMVSASAGVLLTVRTADCVPILLVAPRARAVAAVHAGWQGTLGGVVTSTLGVLGERYGAGPAAVCAALGPAIDGCCYEFGAERFDSFVVKFGRAAERAWQSATRGDRSAVYHPGRGHLDLRLLNRLLLEAAGVPPASISCLGPCTAEHPSELHSYRRDGPRAGRQLSYIGWRS